MSSIFRISPSLFLATILLLRILLFPYTTLFDTLSIFSIQVGPLDVFSTVIELVIVFPTLGFPTFASNIIHVLVVLLMSLLNVPF